MTKDELKKDVAIHYDDGIAMNDHDTAIENIIDSAVDYANKRIVEELEALKICKGVSIDVEILIDDIIEELL